MDSGTKSFPLSTVVSAGSAATISSEGSSVDPVVPMTGIGVSVSFEPSFSATSVSGLGSVAGAAASGSVNAGSVSRTTTPTLAGESEKDDDQCVCTSHDIVSHLQSAPVS